MKSQSDHILELASHQSLLRAADVSGRGWSPQLLLSLYQAGKLQRVARGLYGLPGTEITEHQALMEVCQRVPKAVDHPRLRVTRLRGAAYAEGIERHTINGSPVRVYSLAKTVTDCFKFRNKIGIDVALEALKESWRARKVTMDELTHFAKIKRVERVMQPYLESVAA